MTHSITPIIENSFANAHFRRQLQADLSHETQWAFEQNIRFYQGFCESYPYEPTKDKFQIISTAGKGEALIALQTFEQGEIVFVFDGQLMAEQTLFTLQLQAGQYVEDPYVMGKVLHSCEPNMVADMSTRTFRAAKPIKPNDLLTMDYETTEDELFRKFHCQCQSAQCRGYIQGKNPAKH